MKLPKPSKDWTFFEREEPGETGPVNHLIDPTYEWRRAERANKRADARNAAGRAANERDRQEAIRQLFRGLKHD